MQSHSFFAYNNGFYYDRFAISSPPPPLPFLYLLPLYSLSLAISPSLSLLTSPSLSPSPSPPPPLSLPSYISSLSILSLSSSFFLPIFSPSLHPLCSLYLFPIHPFLSSSLHPTPPRPTHCSSRLHRKSGVVFLYNKGVCADVVMRADNSNFLAKDYHPRRE